jgi:hypothetical protein
MTFWQRLIDALKALFDTNGPAFPPPVPPVPPPPPPPYVVRAVTKDDDFRTLPKVTAARMGEILKDYPLGTEVNTIWEAVNGNPLPIAQSWMESRYGQDENAKRTFNPLGLLYNETTLGKPYLDVGANGVTVKLLKFNSWTEAFMEWNRRMSDPSYRGGVYPPGMTLEQFIFTYVGGPRCLSHGECSNGETQESCRRYLTETVNRLNRYYGISTPVPAQEYAVHFIAGSNTTLTLPKGIPFRQQITTIRPNRTHRKLEAPCGVTQHTTNNPRPDANAAMHANWQASGTPGHPDGAVAVHFYVDDGEIVQTLPVNEQGIHSGDWRNQQHVAVERCTNGGINVARANDYAIALDAGLLKLFGTNADRSLWPHTFNAEGHCPQLGVPWSEFETRVDAALRRLP